MDNLTNLENSKFKTSNGEFSTQQFSCSECGHEVKVSCDGYRMTRVECPNCFKEFEVYPDKIISYN